MGGGRGGGGGGGGKRHYKGGNRKADKEARAQKAEEWKQQRGDDRSGTKAGLWSDTELDNAMFRAFYKAQRFVSDGSEWDEFLKVLRAPLPACFRIYSDYAFAKDLSDELLGFCGEKIEIDEQLSIAAVEQMSWYPNGCAYKLGTDKRNIRKMPRLEGLHKWLVKHTESGNITRQEAVSMVPPLALDVAPHHKCLDMCAAPGSKTSQLLEVVNRSQFKAAGEQGLVVANDPDIDRAYMLVHQCRRFASPQLLVTTHLGQWFPSQRGGEAFFDRVLCDVPCSGDGTMRKNPMIWKRWSTASAYTLHPLQLQIAIRGLQLLKEGGLMVYSTCSMSPYEDEAVVAELLRASNGTLELLDARQFLPKLKTRPGLSHWLVMDDHRAAHKKAGGTFHDASAAAAATAAATEAAAAAAGSEGWLVVDYDAHGPSPLAAHWSTQTAAGGDEMAVEASAPAEEPPAKAATPRSPHPDPLVQASLELGFDVFADHASVPYSVSYVRKSCFPPTEEERAWMNLERCLRCVPHDEDSGGFFVATLRKKASASASASASDSATAAAAQAAPEAEGEEQQASKKLKMSEDAAVVTSTSAPPQAPPDRAPKSFNMVSYEVFDRSDFDKLQEFYGLSLDLPPESMYIRKDLSANQIAKQGTQANGKGAGKSVYYLPLPVRSLMDTSELKIVSAGLKVFERHDSHDGYRLVQEGISSIGPFITKRIVQVTCQDFCNFLEGGLVSFSTMSDAVVKELSELSVGVVVCVYQFRLEDVIKPADGEGEGEEEGRAETGSGGEGNEAAAANVRPMYAVCFRSRSRALNIMCGKKECEIIKHQLASLKVLRPKKLSTVNRTSKEEGQAEAEAEAGAEAVAQAEAEAELELELEAGAEEGMGVSETKENEGVGEHEGEGV